MILIIDDNLTNLKLIKAVLTFSGHSVLTAVDGEEALQVLSSCTPKLILMDLQLPGIDGLELTRRIKADTALNGIPIIALTAYAMKGDEEKVRSAGCDGYITKPINTRTLPQLVDSILYQVAKGGTICV
jgi:CheY-like chemotaxis protein